MSPVVPGKIIWLQNETYPITGILKGWSIGINTAVANLKARNWTITLNGVPQ